MLKHINQRPNSPLAYLIYPKSCYASRPPCPTCLSLLQLVEDQQKPTDRDLYLFSSNRPSIPTPISPHGTWLRTSYAPQRLLQPLLLRSSSLFENDYGKLPSHDLRPPSLQQWLVPYAAHAPIFLQTRPAVSTTVTTTPIPLFQPCVTLE